MVLVLMAAGMASIGVSVVPPCWNESQPSRGSRRRYASTEVWLTHNHGVEASGAEDLRGRDEALGGGELGLEVTLHLDSACGKSTAIVEADISSPGGRGREGEKCY